MAIIQLESCLNMSQGAAEAIRDEQYPGARVYVRECECRECGNGSDAQHWEHPPWVIETSVVPVCSRCNFFVDECVCHDRD